MLTFSSDDRRLLREALSSGFRSYPSLKIFVADHFEFRLDEIANSQATRIAIDNLIEYFEEKGDLSKLILALDWSRPNNPEVKKLMARLQKSVAQRLLLDFSETEEIDQTFELPSFYHDPQLESFLPRPLSYEADLGTLRRGLQLADGVCKIAFSDRPSTGTGILIAPDLILTNYHNLSPQAVADPSQLAAIAQTILFEFGFISQEQEIPASPNTFLPARNEAILACSPPDRLDYVLLRVEPKIVMTNYIKPIPIASPFPSLNPQDGLNLLHHPQGNVMQISLSASGVVQKDIRRGRVWYVNRTQGGSSGSPCFNENWQLVALHHKSMSRGFGSIREGILLSSIWSEIAAIVEQG